MWVFQQCFVTSVFPQDVTASSVVSCSQDKEGLPEKNRPSPVQSERDALLIGMLPYCISMALLHLQKGGGRVSF